MKTKDIVNISLFTTLLAVCAWVCIPTVVPFTMQTFAIFLAMLVLGGRNGTIVIFIYLFLGMIGVPVFSKGTAGIGVMFGSTGGYMFGWILLGLIMWLADFLAEKGAKDKSAKDKSAKDKKRFQTAGLILGLIASYTTGTLWFVQIYAKEAKDAGGMGFAAALGMCVLPFVIPDLIKMAMALIVSKRMKKIVGIV